MSVFANLIDAACLLIIQFDISRINIRYRFQRKRSIAIASKSLYDLISLQLTLLSCRRQSPRHGQHGGKKKSKTDNVINIYTFSKTRPGVIRMTYRGPGTWNDTRQTRAGVHRIVVTSRPAEGADSGGNLFTSHPFGSWTVFFPTVKFRVFYTKTRYFWHEY